MIKLTRSGVGTVDHAGVVRDTNGTGLLPMQAEVTGTATFRVLGKVSPEAPWVELRAANTTAFLESFSYVPFIRLEITTGTGTVNLWIAEQ
jgi:hypothetical protein